jgi:2-phosphoglycerate kinase
MNEYHASGWGPCCRSSSASLDRARIGRYVTAPDSLKGQLRRVRWIGGGSGAGKSTVARRLAVAYGLSEYSCDDAIPDHARRCGPSDAPLSHAFLAMDIDERWVKRPPTVMFETFPWFHGEGFELILDDVLALAEQSPVLVEGFRLLPRLVAPLLSEPHQAVWLVPTTEFRRQAFRARGNTWFPYETSHPERALANLLVRDDLFAREVVKEAADLRLPVLEVDARLSTDELTSRVKDCLGFGAP